MSTVRELKNRITFNVDKSTVTRAEQSFSALKKGAQIAITTVKGIGAAITALVGTSAFKQMQAEAGIGSVNFFSRSAKDAEELLKLTKQIADVSDTTSLQEAIEASVTLSKIPGIEKFRKDLLPLLEVLSVAQPNLDFADIAESFSRLVKDGNLDELQNLIPGSAEMLEKLGLSTFNFADRTKTAANRTELFIEQSKKVRAEIERLAEAQRKTERFQFEGVKKETADFFNKFGEASAPVMTELFKEIRTTIGQLNDNKEFWKGVESVSKSVLGAFKETKAIIIEINKKGFLGFGKDVISEQVKQKKGKGDRFSGAEQLLGSFAEGNIFSDFNSLLENAFGSGFTPNQQKQTTEQNLNINGSIDVNVNGDAASSVNKETLTRIVTQRVTEGLKEKVRNITAKRGGTVSNGGVPLVAGGTR